MRLYFNATLRIVYHYQKTFQHHGIQAAMDSDALSWSQFYDMEARTYINRRLERKLRHTEHLKDTWSSIEVASGI